jgi:hypothetical protein
VTVETACGHEFASGNDSRVGRKSLTFKTESPQRSELAFRATSSRSYGREDLARIAVQTHVSKSAMQKRAQPLVRRLRPAP